MIREIWPFRFVRVGGPADSFRVCGVWFVALRRWGIAAAIGWERSSSGFGDISSIIFDPMCRAYRVKLGGGFFVRLDVP